MASAVMFATDLVVQWQGGNLLCPSALHCVSYARWWCLRRKTEVVASELALVRRPCMLSTAPHLAAGV